MWLTFGGPVFDALNAGPPNDLPVYRGPLVPGQSRAPRTVSSEWSHSARATHKDPLPNIKLIMKTYC
jgi:hypothetical protein